MAHFKTEADKYVYCSEVKDWGIVGAPGGWHTDVKACSGCQEADPEVKVITEAEADALPVE